MEVSLSPANYFSMVVLLWCLSALFLDAYNVSDLPDDIKRSIQEDALHLYKYAKSPMARVLTLTETSDYFPTLHNALYPDVALKIYQMPSNRYLTMWQIRQRETHGSVSVFYDAKGSSCHEADLYYHAGGDEDQLLPATGTDPGSFQLFSRMISVHFRLKTATEEDFGRTVLLYIPPQCTLKLTRLSVTQYSSSAPELPFQIVGN